MRPRFQADADFNQIVVVAVVRQLPEVDFRTATLAGLAGLTGADALRGIHSFDVEPGSHRRAAEANDTPI